MYVYKNLITRDMELSRFDRFQFFYIRVKDFDYLGKDIVELYWNEELFNQTVFFKIERTKVIKRLNF